jgi:HAE1 family hydrophobic/amphiphilic exporter-1
LTLGRYLLVNALNLLNVLTVTLHGWSEALLEWAREAYGKSLYGSLGRSGWILLGAGLFFVSGFFALTRLGFTFTPRSDESQAQVTLKLPPGSSLQETNAATKQLENYLLARPEVKQIATTVGASSGGLSSATESGRATLSIDLVGIEEREGIFTLMPKIQDQLRAMFKNRPELDLRASAQSTGPGGSSDLSLQLTAPTQARLSQVGLKVLAAIKQDPDILNATSSLAETSLERVYLPDPTQLAGTGLTPQDLAQTIRTANSGAKGGDFRDGDESYDIIVKLDSSQVKDEQSFLSLPIYTSSLQSNLTLGDLGRFELRQVPATLYRFNKRASAQLDINFKPGVSSFGKLRSIEADLKARGLLSEEVTLGVSGFGVAGLTNDLLLYGPLAILIAVLLNYLVLGAQFNSFKYPLYLLLPVPLAVMGGVWALFWFGAPLDVITVLGMVVLVGLSTKNSILLLDFVVRESQKMPLGEALVSAAKLRLRPIVMTTLTVLVISFPLIFGGGEGSEFRRGLGIVILGGILTSALLTLYVVPAAFYRFERKNQAKPEPNPAPAVPVATD